MKKYIPGFHIPNMENFEAFCWDISSSIIHKPLIKLLVLVILGM